MKKLMFMLAAAVAVVSAQAASVSWTCTNVKDGDGNAISGVAYFINAATLSQDAFKALSGADAFNTALSGMYSYTPTDAGKYTVSSTAAVANSALGLSDTTTYSVYLAIFDTATITDSSNYYLTSPLSLTTVSGAETAQIKFGSQSTASQAAGAWTSVNVPEPTSGLLMLVGLGALALRRRRA